MSPRGRRRPLGWNEAHTVAEAASRARARDRQRQPRHLRNARELAGMSALKWETGEEEARLAELQKPLLQTMMNPPSPEECEEAWGSPGAAARLLSRWGKAYKKAPESVQNDLTLTKTALLSYPAAIDWVPAALKESNGSELAWLRIKGVMDRIDHVERDEDKRVWAATLDEARGYGVFLESLVERCIHDHPEAYRVLPLVDGLRHEHHYDFDAFMRMTKTVVRSGRSLQRPIVATMLASDPLFCNQDPVARTVAAQAVLLILRVSSKYPKYTVLAREMQALIGRVPTDRSTPDEPQERSSKRQKTHGDTKIAANETIRRILASFEHNGAALGVDGERDDTVMHIADTFLEPFFGAINDLYEANDPPPFLNGMCPPSGCLEGQPCGQALGFDDEDGHLCRAKSSESWGFWNEDSWVCYDCTVKPDPKTGCCKKTCAEFNHDGACELCRPSAMCFA
jgi:hypothetical protein